MQHKSYAYETDKPELQQHSLIILLFSSVLWCFEEKNGCCALIHCWKSLKFIQIIAFHITCVFIEHLYHGIFSDLLPVHSAAAVGSYFSVDHFFQVKSLYTSISQLKYIQILQNFGPCICIFPCTVMYLHVLSRFRWHMGKDWLHDCRGRGVWKKIVLHLRIHRHKCFFLK